MIPYTGVKAIHAQVDLINKKLGYEAAKAFTGATKDRAQLIEDVRSGKVRVLVGTAKLLSTGVNIPRASALYETIISNNKFSATQRFARILTPMEGKCDPIIRIFCDDMDIRRHCLANEFWNVMIRQFRATISDIDMASLKSYFSQKTY